MADTRLYPEQDPESLEPFYTRHLQAMTAEGLHEKSDIAAQLAVRDQQLNMVLMANSSWAGTFERFNAEVESMRKLVERLRDEDSWRNAHRKLMTKVAKLITSNAQCKAEWASMKGDVDWADVCGWTPIAIQPKITGWYWVAHRGHAARAFFAANDIQWTDRIKRGWDDPGVLAFGPTHWKLEVLPDGLQTTAQAGT